MLRLQEIPADSIKRERDPSLLSMSYMLGDYRGIVVRLIPIIFLMSSLAGNSFWLLNIIIMGLTGLHFNWSRAAWKWEKWGGWGLGAFLVAFTLLGLSVNTPPNLHLFVLLLIKFGLLVHIVGRR